MKEGFGLLELFMFFTIFVNSCSVDSRTVRIQEKVDKLAEKCK